MKSFKKLLLCCVVVVVPHGKNIKLTIINTPQRVNDELAANITMVAYNMQRLRASVRTTSTNKMDRELSDIKKESKDYLRAYIRYLVY